MDQADELTLSDVRVVVAAQGPVHPSGFLLCLMRDSFLNTAHCLKSLRSFLFHS